MKFKEFFQTFESVYAKKIIKKGPSTVKRMLAAGKCKSPSRPVVLDFKGKPSIIRSGL